MKRGEWVWDVMGWWFLRRERWTVEPNFEWKLGECIQLSRDNSLRHSETSNFQIIRAQVET